MQFKRSKPVIMWRGPASSPRSVLEALDRLELELADEEIKRLEAALRKSGRNTRYAALRTAWAAHDGGGHTEAWVSAQVAAQIAQMIDARPSGVSFDAACYAVMRWLEHPAR